MTNATAPEGRFGRLFFDEYRHVLAYALRRTSNLADAEDAVAETFAVAWRRILDAPAPEAVRPWLYGIAWRTIANQRRSMRRLAAVRDRLRSQPSALVGTQETVERQHEWDAVLRALARLSRNDQEVLRLAAWESLSHHEIGVVLGCSENAAAIRLHRARRRLAEELTKEDASSGHSAAEMQVKH